MEKTVINLASFDIEPQCGFGCLKLFEPGEKDSYYYPPPERDINHRIRMLNNSINNGVDGIEFHKSLVGAILNQFS